MENDLFAQEFDNFESDRETDSNNDIIDESILEELSIDIDSNVNLMDFAEDTDNDGRIDSINYIEDKDGDGEFELKFTAIDKDNDGEFDEIEFEEDKDSDGESELKLTAIDRDSDGEFDEIEFEEDKDSDGESELKLTAIDKDSDGEFDEVTFKEDKDSDGEFEKETIAYDEDSDGEFDDFKVVKNSENDSESDEQSQNNSNIGDLVDIIDNAEVSEFDQEDDNTDIIGDPDDDMEHWHMQQHDDTCAIVAQEFILDDIGEEYGIDFTEEELREEAIENGWYIPGGGTPFEHVGKLLEANGVEVETNQGCTLEDLENKLEDGEKIIVGIDADEIWYEESDFDDSMFESLGMPGQDANHAVQVIGIDNSDPDNPVVILNDPGTPDGKGLRVPAEQFVDAWEDSDSAMFSTTGNVDESLLIA